MNPDPPDPDEELDAAYLFADPAAPPEPPAPEPPRTRKKKRRRAEGEEPAAEAPREIGDRILQREEESPGRWWAVPAGLIAVGFLLCLVPIVYVMVKGGAGIGVALLAAAVVGIVVQVAAVTAFLSGVGYVFGIDYGPAVQAVVKLAAVVVLVDGLTGSFLLINPCALVVAVLVGCGVFQYLFRLSVFEMLLSVAGMVGAAWVLNAVVVVMLLKRG